LSFLGASAAADITEFGNEALPEPAEIRCPPDSFQGSKASSRNPSPPPASSMNRYSSSVADSISDFPREGSEEAPVGYAQCESGEISPYSERATPTYMKWAVDLQYILEDFEEKGFVHSGERLKNLEEEIISIVGFIIHNNIYKSRRNLAACHALAVKGLKKKPIVYMNHLEVKALKECSPEFQLLLHVRLVDDIFLLFQPNEDELKRLEYFVNYMNGQDEKGRIHFTTEVEVNTLYLSGRACEEDPIVLISRFSYIGNQHTQIDTLRHEFLLGYLGMW
uniref:RNA-directed DNA polymerase n=1 Tax=Soboliphyme baturini TaxID=241478 RepID=A0A183J921_9BILA